MNGHLCGSIPITVVYPSGFSSSSSAFDDTPEIGSAPEKVKWTANVTITIKDQFSRTLGANWNGIAVSETIQGLGSGPLENLGYGSINDPVTLEITGESHEWALQVVRDERILSNEDPFPTSYQNIFGGGAQMNGLNTRTKTLVENVFTVFNSH